MERASSGLSVFMPTLPCKSERRREREKEREREGGREKERGKEIKGVEREREE